MKYKFCFSFFCYYGVKYMCKPMITRFYVVNTLVNLCKTV